MTKVTSRWIKMRGLFTKLSLIDLRREEILTTPPSHAQNSLPDKPRSRCKDRTKAMENNLAGYPARSLVMKRSINCLQTTLNKVSTWKWYRHSTQPFQRERVSLRGDSQCCTNQRLGAKRKEPWWTEGEQLESEVWKSPSKNYFLCQREEREREAHTQKHTHMILGFVHLQSKAG